MEKKRPIPVSNQKIKDWNKFLVDFNAAAEAELPKKADGTPNWELLDKNKAFGNYKGGQDFYKKKFAEYVANKGVTGPDRLTEADFPVIQKLYADTYTAAKADQDYFNTYTKPRLEREKVDLNTFDPSATITGKGNTEGWVGSVTRHFTFDQDDRTGKGGTNPATQQHLETFFPASFSQGESFYKKNPTGPGVRYFDKGGELSMSKAKKILHDKEVNGKPLTDKQRKFMGVVASGYIKAEHGGQLMCGGKMAEGGKMHYEDGGEVEYEDDDLEAISGGDLEEISENHMMVNSDEKAKDDVTLTTGDKVGDKEVINTKTKLVFGNLTDPATGNLFKDDAVVRAKEMGQLENHPMPWAKRRLDVLKRQEAEAGARQQNLNGDNGGTSHDEGGNLNPEAKVDVDPPVKKKLFYVPEDETMYQVSEDKIPKYADKLKNATEYTDVQPEGYTSDKVFLEKNGVLKEFTKENAEIILKQPEAAGSRQVYPVSTGQKKNQDVHAIYKELDAVSRNTGSLGKTQESIEIDPADQLNSESYKVFEKENKAYEDVVNGIPQKEGEMEPYNQIIKGSLDKFYSEADLFKIKDIAYDRRQKDNENIGQDFINTILNKDEEAIFKEHRIATPSEGFIGIEGLQTTSQFRKYVDNHLVGTKKIGDKTYNFNTMPSGQKEEIRNYVIGNYQTVKKLNLAQDRIEVLTSPESSGDKGVDDWKKMSQEAIKNKTGIDITKLHSEDWWLASFDKFKKDRDKINQDYANLASQIPIKIKKETDPITTAYNIEDQGIVEQGMKEIEEARQGMQHLVDAGEVDPEEANKILKDSFNKLEFKRTEYYNQYSREINRVAQQKIDLANKTLELKWEGEIAAAMKEAGIEGDPVENAKLYNELVKWEFGNIATDENLRLKKEAEDLVNIKGDWEQIKTNLNRGTLQLFDGLGGGLKWLGWYEGGNMLTDWMDEFNAANPQKQIQWDGASSLMNKDWWIEKGATTVPSTLLFIVPAMVVTGGAGALAAEIGLEGAGATMFQGFAGALATRPLESFIEAGTQFQNDLEAGASIEKASDRASSVFTNNMKLIFTDGLQLGLAFTKFGKLSGWKAGLIKMPVEMITEGSEEVYQELVVEQLDNPYATFFQYLKSPAGQETFALGAAMGLPFAAPDLVSNVSKKQNQQQLGLLMDMMGDPNNLDVRYKQILQEGELLTARGMMTPEEFKALQTKAEFVLTKNRDIPVDLPVETRKAVLYKLADIQDATNVSVTSADPTIKKTYEDKVKELEKEVKELISGDQPTYFINNALYTEQEFKKVLADDYLFQSIVDQDTPIQIFNDPKMEQEVMDRKAQFGRLPEEVNISQQIQQSKIQSNDSENKTGVQSDLGEGKKSIETKLDVRSSEEATRNDRVVQEEQDVESTLTDEEELAEANRYDQEQKVVEEYYTSKNEPLPTEEEMDELNGLFTIDDGQMLDVDGDPTNINDVVKKYTELKEGTAFESSDGKIRYIREKGEIVRRDAKGNRVEAQTYVSKKVTPKNYKELHEQWEKGGKKGKEPIIGKEYKVKSEPQKGVVYNDRKTIEKYDQERLEAGLEEGTPTGDANFDKIAKTSNSPKEIKAAWEEEKSRLDEINATEGAGDKTELIYDMVKNGVSKEDAKILDLDNRDGSISTKGWKIFKKGPGSIDTKIDAINEKFGTDITLDDVADFIKEYKKGPHEYKKVRQETLKSLEDRYKKLTGVNIKNVPRETKEEKTKAQVKPKKEEPKVSVAPTNTEKAKELADKIRSFKSKPKTIKLTDENGNEIEGIINTNSFFDEILEVAALAVEATGKLADGVKAALVHVRKQDWYKKLTPEGQVTVDGQIKEMIEGEEEEVKKTITTHRAYEGEFREGVKKELEKLGLTREIENQAEAKKKAKEFIESVGEETALEAVRNNDVADGVGAYVWNELIEGVETKLASEKNPETIMELEKMEAQLIDEFSRKALSGGRFSAALGDIYQNSDLGYNVEKKIKEYKDQNNGEIPAEVEAKFRAIDKELKEVRKKLVEAEKRAKDAEAQLAIDNIKESIDRSKTDKSKKEYAQKALNAIGKLRKSLRANMYSDAVGFVAIVDMGLSTIETAIKGGMAISKAIDKGVKYIKGRLKEQGIDEWEKEDKFRKDVEEGFRQEGINVWETADGKLKIPNSVIRDFVERGIDNIEDLTKAIQNEIKEIYPDATEREVRDAITGYGKTVNLNSDEISGQIRKMKRVGRIISSLEDITNKKRPLKSGIQRDKLDAEERALNKELREAMKDLPMDEELQADQLKTATDAAKQRLKNQIEDLQREIDKGEQVKKTARTIQEDEELAALRKQRDELRKQHEAIFKDEEFKEKQRLENTKKATQRRIKELETKIKEGDFSKKKPKSLIADDDLTKLRAEKIRLQEEYDKEFYKNKLTNRTKAQKIKDSIWDAWGLTRLFSATGEFSFIGIQGLIQTIAHPLHAVEALKNALRFFASEKKTEQWLNTIKSQPFYPEMKQAKLALTETNAEITAREELFYSDWANMIWNILGSPLKLINKETYKKWGNLSPFKAFERAALGYLDTLRVMRFLDGKEMLENQGISSEDNPEAYKQMADVINTMTGRASLGKAEMIAPVLTKIFFSPRNWASVFKTATPYAFYHFGKMRAGAEGFKPSVAQKMAIADFSKFVGLTISFVALAAAYLNNDDDDETGVEFDPRSSDFLKIKVGVKRIDPWGGRIQQVILLSRLISGSVKKEDGKIIPLGTPFKTPTRKDLLIEMATNKLAPSASMLEKFLSTRINEDGERVTKFGQPYEFTDELKEKLTPIYWGTVKDLLKDDPTALDGILVFYAFIGGGVNVYETKEEKAAKKKKDE